MNDIRIGYGYDVHRLTEGRPLILGGLHIDHPKGLAGHSDADVLLHAITDALFGALALGDIGTHFPDTDEAFRGADSRALLREATDIIHEKGYTVGNVDATVVAQAPKLAPHIPAMRKGIAGNLSIAEDRVSVKATTSEGLSFEGDEQGMSATAAVLLVKASA